MADPFVVTSPSTAVTLGAPNRTGRVTYTVTNISGRPLRARLRLVPLEPTKAEWLRVDGEAERNFALGGTENFTAVLTVPPDAPAGTYLLRADAVGEDQPDEVYTLGPTVAASVSDPVVKRGFPWWIAAVAAAVVVAAVAVFMVISNSGKSNGKPAPAASSALPPATVIIPTGLEGQPENVALSNLTARGLKPIPTVGDVVGSCNPSVIAVPGAGTAVPVGSSVYVVVPPRLKPNLCLLKAPPVTIHAPSQATPSP